MRLVYLTLGWVIGVVLVLEGSALPQAGWLGLSGLAALTAALTWRQPTFRWYNLALLLLCLGGLRASFVPISSDVAAFNNSGGLTIEGTVIAAPDVRDTQTLLRVDVDTVIRGGTVFNTDGLVLAQVPRFSDVAYGDRVRVTGALVRPGEYDTFSYADFLAQQGVFSIMDRASVEVLSSGHGSPILTAIFDLRTTLYDTIGRALPEPQAGLLNGILLGNERGISPEVDEAFSRTGASHVIAISGFNMAIIAALVMGILSYMPLPRYAKAIIGVLVIGVYTVFTGMNPAVVRAAVMSGVLIIGQALDRRAYVPASLAAVAMIMSALDPNVLYSISFQLSFLAVLGLAVFVDPLQRAFNQGLQRLFPRRYALGIGGVLSEPLIVTIAASITTQPIILLYFERLSVVSLLVNLLIVPVQTYLLLIGGLATLLVLVIPPLAQALYWLDYVFLSWTIGVVRFFGALPFADTGLRIADGLVYGFFMGLVGWVIMDGAKPAWWLRFGRFLRSRAVTATLFVGGGGLIALLAVIYFDQPDGDLHVWFLDAGHSNAIFIETPGGAHILVDGGRFPSRLLTAIGDRVPLTDRQLEVIVISQPDPFDFQAVPAVLNRYDAGVILTNGQPNQGAAYAELLDAAAPFEIVPARAGYTVEFDDGVLLEVLHPFETPELGTGLNAAPLVLRLSYGEVSFLLPSDLSREAQAAMLEAGGWPLTTVLQLPDHGTARSLDPRFLDAAQPSLVVVQADPANRRGDPNPDVLALLPEGVPVLRTDQDGTIHLWTDGVHLWTEGSR